MPLSGSWSQASISPCSTYPVGRGNPRGTRPESAVGAWFSANSTAIDPPIECPQKTKGDIAEGIDEFGKESQVFPCASKNRSPGVSVARQINRKGSVTGLQVPKDSGASTPRSVAGAVHQEHELAAAVGQHGLPKGSR